MRRRRDFGRHHRREGLPRAQHRPHVVKASEAAKNFGALVDRVREERAVYIVERAGAPVVQISPVGRAMATVADLVDLLRAPDRLDDTYLREVEQAIAFLNEPAVPAKSSWES
jgi:antitoxin (DNA-binding transcriptional repressor) of toxin-antitoxin stability system